MVYLRLVEIPVKPEIREQIKALKGAKTYSEFLQGLLESQIEKGQGA